MRPDRTGRMVAALLAAALHWADASAALSAEDRGAVERYRAAIGSAQAGVQPALEEAFAALAVLRAALMGERGGRTVLEALDEPEFAALQGELPGTFLNREEVVLVVPDPVYFRRLAARHGDAADKAFFAAWQATYGRGAWPVYIEQQTDTTGCTRFGSARLVASYRAWDGFRRSHPGRYAEAAATQAQAVLDELALSTCACGSMAQVESELQRFVRAFPAAAAEGGVERRLQAVRAGRSEIRAHCVSG